MKIDEEYDDVDAYCNTMDGNWAVSAPLRSDNGRKGGRTTGMGTRGTSPLGRSSINFSPSEVLIIRCLY